MKKLFLTISAISTGLFSLPAFAHHVMDNQTPATLWQGLISGFAHPIIGIDHFAFIIAVGVLAAFQKNRALLPAGFVTGGFFGCVMFLQGVPIPLGELWIAASVVLIGVIAMRGKTIAAYPAFGLLIAAGLLHGHAYGGGIIGAEATPLIAYLIGLSLIQFAVAFALAETFYRIYQIHLPHHVTARLTGAVIAGVGGTFLIETIETIIFATV